MKNSPKHILLVTSEFPPLPGGIGNHALNLASFLSKNNYEVEVLADQRTTNSEESDFDATQNFNIDRITLTKIRLFMFLCRIWVIFQIIRSK
ncbi:MAG: glycosyltransferase, partial [Bacteroidia bacterium]|nr:glycosyltransferase [Bacteroidia bacterium]